MPADSCPAPAPTSARPRSTPRRYLALWLPFLSTERARRDLCGKRDDRPFVLVEKARGALRIAACDPLAARTGVTLGMPLAQARALWPDLETAAADTDGDATVLRHAAELCEMFTPLVAVRGIEGLLLDITGCAHLFGGEGALLQQARRRLTRLGLTGCAAIGATPDAAWAFARHRCDDIITRGNDEQIGRALPIAALDPAPDTAMALRRAGFRTLDDLAARPSRMLAARFGMPLVDRLNRVLGREDIRITPLRPPPDIVADAHFSVPLAHADSLLGALERLAREVSIRLEQRGMGGRAFEASFFRADGIVRRIRIETAQGARTPDVLMRLLRLKIVALADPLDPGFGFDAIRIAVVRSEAVAASQATLAGGSEGGAAESEMAALVDRLVARFGREAVRRFVAQETHDPARACGTVPSLSDVASAAWPMPEPGQPPARPLTLFAQPQPIDVVAQTPDSPPSRFRWRGAVHDVTRAEGPERIAAEWWQAPAGSGERAAATRDYYRVEDANGHRVWIFRQGRYEDGDARPLWFLHGLFA